MKSFRTTRDKNRGFAVVAAMLLAAAAAVGGLSAKHAAGPRAVLEQALAGRDAGWAVRVAVPRQPWPIGHDVTDLHVETARSGQLFLLQAGTDGKALDLIFPNDLDGDNAVEAGDTVLPRPEWRLAAQGPAGEGALLAVVADDPPDIETIRAALAAGKPPQFGAAYGAALVPWREAVEAK